ncbi:MAG: nicotinamide riboside transporter PnuC [bacterium]|nr:nicotinamide riboside transporter PnuC [bacterium]
MVYEIIGSSAGVLYVWLMSKQNVWCWPVGIIYILMSYIVFFNAHLYAELFSHTVFLILTFYGWYIWIKKKKATPLQVSSLNQKSMLILLFINIFFSFTFGFTLYKFTNNAMPFVDGPVAILSFTGMWLSGHKKIENWSIWMVVNLVSICLYIQQGLYLYVVLYVVFFFMAINGHFSWQRSKLFA